MKTLVIEDAPVDQKLITKQLAGLSDYHVTVDNAESALDLLASGEQFDLLLVDWNLPGMSGLDFITRLRKDHSVSAMKVVMLTGENDMQHVNEAIAAGVDEYLMKPITRETFLEKLKLVGFSSPDSNIKEIV